MMPGFLHRLRAYSNSLSRCMAVAVTVISGYVRSSLSSFRTRLFALIVYIAPTDIIKM